jgi:Protein of unknown function (DUF1585)
LEDSDEPAIKKIVRQTIDNNYRFSSLIVGIVNSEPFQKRRGAVSPVPPVALTMKSRRASQ